MQQVAHRQKRNTPQMQNVHEIAGFKKFDDEWKYVAGNVIPTTVKRVCKKVGRNEPCPCGSGKKYKNCCGR